MATITRFLSIRMPRNLWHQWEVLIFDLSIMRVVTFHPIGRKETRILPWLSPWLCTTNKMASVLAERDPSPFLPLSTTYLYFKLFWESFKVAHRRHNTLFWIAIRYTTWSPAIVCWVTWARCFESRWGEETEALMSKLTSFDKVLSGILKRDIIKISALFFF